MRIDFSNGMMVEDSILRDIFAVVADTAAKAILKEYLCMAVIEEIFDKAKEKMKTGPITFSQQCLEEHKR